jgi:DNA-binding transcriptional regulator YiaG
MSAIADVKRMYGLIRDGILPDDCGGLQDRVNIVRRLEELTCSEFGNTADFHNKVSAFLARNDNNGTELRIARRDRKWTLERMGAYLGVSRQFVHQMELSRKPLNDKALELIGQKPISPYGEPQNG